MDDDGEFLTLLQKVKLLSKSIDDLVKKTKLVKKLHQVKMSKDEASLFFDVIFEAPQSTQGVDERTAGWIWKWRRRRRAGDQTPSFKKLCGVSCSATAARKR
eukprot:9475192-Pyramimonas_sp.AAC.1